MSVSLRVSSPVAVVRGPAMEEVGWGPYQYPALYRTDDGKILLSCSSGLDSYTSYGQECHWFLSSDEGETWEAVEPQYKDFAGTLLPDGSRLYTESRLVTPVDVSLLPEPIAVHKVHGPIYELSFLPDDLIAKDWLYRRREPDGTMTNISWKLDFPHYTASLRDGNLITPFPVGHIRLAPDGSLWQTHYGIQPDPENGGYSPYYNLFFLRSTDRGSTWKLMSWLPYVPDTREFPEAFTGAEGFCEADLVFPPDGSMVTLIRSGSVTPSYIARSTDGGLTWSKPVVYDKCGVWPTLLTLSCGVTVSGYGRPGFYLRATEDPSAMVWDDPVELISPRDHSGDGNVPMAKYDDAWVFGTCSYCDLLALSDRSFLVAYSDFYAPDETGYKRKTIFVRRVTAEA